MSKDIHLIIEFIWKDYSENLFFPAHKWIALNMWKIQIDSSHYWLWEFQISIYKKNAICLWKTIIFMDVESRDLNSSDKVSKICSYNTKL